MDAGGLEAAGDDLLDLAEQLGQVGLVARSGGEVREHLRGIVVGTVEDPVDGPLDALAHGVEEQHDDRRGQRDGRPRVLARELAEEGLEEDDGADVGHHENGGHDEVEERLANDDVHVEEMVPPHGDRHRHGKGQQGQAVDVDVDPRLPDDDRADDADRQAGDDGDAAAEQRPLGALAVGSGLAVQVLQNNDGQRGQQVDDGDHRNRTAAGAQAFQDAGGGGPEVGDDGKVDDDRAQVERRDDPLMAADGARWARVEEGKVHQCRIEEHGHARHQEAAQPEAIAGDDIAHRQRQRPQIHLRAQHGPDEEHPHGGHLGAAEEEPDRQHLRDKDEDEKAPARLEDGHKRPGLQGDQQGQRLAFAQDAIDGQRVGLERDMAAVGHEEAHRPFAHRDAVDADHAVARL